MSLTITKKLANSLTDLIEVVDGLEERGAKVCKCGDGYICIYCTAKMVLSAYRDSVKSNIGIPNAQKRRVYCITTDRYFKNFAIAGREYFVNPSNIAKCCYGDIHSAGKFNGERLKWRLI